MKTLAPLFLITFVLCNFLPNSLPAQNPVNDLLCNSIALIPDTPCEGNLNGSTQEATLQSGEPTPDCASHSGDGQSVWYHFIAPASGMALISTNHPFGSLVDTDIALYTLEGNCASLNNLVPYACNQNENQTVGFYKASYAGTFTPGETYYIQVLTGTEAKRNVEPGSFCLTVSTLDTPNNDNPENAISVSVADTAQVFHNVGASAEPAERTLLTPEGAPAFMQGGWIETNIQHSVWFTFEVPASGAVEVQTYNPFAVLRNELPGTFNTQVAVYRASDPANWSSFELLDANDDDLSTLAALWLTCLTPGETLYILVDGSSEVPGLASQGQFLLDIREIPLAPLELKAVVEAPLCEGQANGSIRTQVSGGLQPYSYQWNTGHTEPDQLRTLGAGAYTLTVTDHCGASISRTFEIEDPAPFSVNLASDTAYCGDESVPIQLVPQIQGGRQIIQNRVFSMELDKNLNKSIVVNFPFNKPERIDTLSAPFEEGFHNYRMSFYQDKLLALAITRDLWYEVDTKSGNLNLLRRMTPPPGEFWQGLAYNPLDKVLYGLTGYVDDFGATYGRLYEVNPYDPDVTLIGEFTDVAPVWLAINDAGEFYSADFFTGDFLRLDPRSAQVERIGPLGVDPQRFSGASFDPSSDELYFIHHGGNFDSELYQIDLEKGTAQFSGHILGTSFMSGCAIAPDTVGAAYQFKWEGSSMLLEENLLTPWALPDSTATYKITVSDECGVQVTATTRITRNDPPRLNWNPTPDPRSGTTRVELEVEGGRVPYSFDWSNGAKTSSVSNLVAGLYQVEVTDAADCSVLETVSVDPVYQIVGEKASLSRPGLLQVRPNPAKDRIQVDMYLQPDEETQVMLYDMQGNMLQSHTPSEELSMFLTIEDLRPGIYVVVLENSTGKFYQRFLKQ